MEFSLTTLGTASALPTANRFPSAHILTVHERLFLIDCGEGAQMQMRKAGFSFSRLDRIFISHLHGDHLFGIFGLLSTLALSGRTAPLHIYAPGDFEGILRFFLSRFGEGIKYEIACHKVKCRAPEQICELRSLVVEAFPLVHRGETYGYSFREKVPLRNLHKHLVGPYGLSLIEMARLKEGYDIIRFCRRDNDRVADRIVSGGDEIADEERLSGFERELRLREGVDLYRQVLPAEEFTYAPYKPRRFSYCSDTAPFDELAGWVRGSDLLYHEATYGSELAEQAKATFHSTASDAAHCALEAGAGRLVMGHYSSRYKTLEPLLDEARRIFPESYLAREGIKFDIPLNK